MKILSMGDRIRPGRYAVRTRYNRSILLLSPSNRVLFVVDRSIGPGPLNILVNQPDKFVDGETLRIPRRLETPRFDSAMPPHARLHLHTLAARLHTALPRHAPPESLISLFFPRRRMPIRQMARDTLFRQAFEQLADGDLAGGIRRIRGCGEGLTPSGDDFLCGWMLACRLKRRPSLARDILREALGQNAVSNAFLELSAAGRVNIAVQQLLSSPSPARVRMACSFGHSSGADLLCGLYWGLPFPPPVPPEP
ncbi:MAG: DUF2877 domain-containing protein [Lentisphaerae bacterium]|nr:DUF2877 domain-containing protein [Lentisphaerota bacterium]